MAVVGRIEKQGSLIRCWLYMAFSYRSRRYRGSSTDIPKKMALTRSPSDVMVRPALEPPAHVS